MAIHFNIDEQEDIYNFIGKYVDYYNYERPAYALNYKSPVQYRTERGFG